MPKPYPPEFRRRALDLVATGRSVRDVAASLEIAESCWYGWKSRHLTTVVSNRVQPWSTQPNWPPHSDGSASLRTTSRSCGRPPRRSSRWCPQKERVQLVAELVDDGVLAKRACSELGVPVRVYE